MLGIEVNGSLEGYSRIIPLRKMIEVDSISYFKNDVFYALIRNISIRGTNIKPYADSEIKAVYQGFEGLEVGQTFILRDKILSIMENLSGNGLFRDFIMNGISNMLPLQVYGKDSGGKKAIAFYIPAIVEIHNDEAVLLDGMHRTNICGSAGSAIKVIQISKVGARLPFEPISWRDIKSVDEKPDIGQRYVDLKPELFRDLSVVGIDG